MDELTPERIAAIRAELAAITPPPWTATCRDVAGENNDSDFLGWEIQGPPDAYKGQFARAADARFIAAAPERIAALCDALDAARARIAELESRITAALQDRR